MTSLERKSRAVNAQDIASQFANTLGKDTPVKKLKSKNSELLSKYREKLKSESDTADVETDYSISEAGDEERKSKLIPKVTGSFKGVNFDKSVDEHNQDQRQENKKRSWRKGKKFDPKKNFQNDNNKNNGNRRFKPFKRNKNNNGKNFQKNERF